MKYRVNKLSKYKKIKNTYVVCMRCRRIFMNDTLSYHVICPCCGDALMVARNKKKAIDYLEGRKVYW